MAQVASIYYIERLEQNPKDVFDEYYLCYANLRRPKPAASLMWDRLEKDAAEVIDN
jgi:hypothetical protein